MATLPVQKTTDVGITLTFTAVTAQDDFVNDGQTKIIVNNGDASVNNVTIVTTQTVAGLDVQDRARAVAAGAIDSIGPFPVSLYGSTVTVNFSNQTSNTVAVVSG